MLRFSLRDVLKVLKTFFRDLFLINGTMKKLTLLFSKNENSVFFFKLMFS